MADQACALSPGEVVSAYIGTVVGAGFATGQEVLQFFGFHGVNGVLGLFLTTALLVTYGAIIMILGHRLNAVSYLEVVRETAGVWVDTVIDAVITFFLLGGFAAMAAGSAAVFEEYFGIPGIWGGLTMVALSVTVRMGIQGVLSSIGAIAPFLVGIVLIVSFLSIVRAPINWAWSQPLNAAIPFWPISSVAYASFNLVLAIAILAPMDPLTDPEGPRFFTFTVLAGLVGYLGSLLGFTDLVAKLYSAVGYAGFLLLAALTLAYTKRIA